MNSEILSANQLIHESQASAQRFNLFKALIGESDAVPLDGNGMFSLVKTKRYNEILQSLEESQKLKEQMEQKCYILNLNNIELDKQVELLNKQIRKFKQNEASFQQHISKIQKSLKEKQFKIIEIETSLREALIKKSQPQIMNRPEKILMTSLTISTGIQTSWQDSKLDEIVEEALNDATGEKESMSAQERLYGLLRGNAQKFEAQFRQKMNKLHESQLMVDRWEEEKEQYRLENQHLKTQLQARNLEDEKLRIWKESISSMVQRVEKTINEPQAYKIVPEQLQNIEDNEWKKDALRQARLAELKIRMREAQEEMKVVEEGEEEGPVNTLVRLSQKVRTLVQGMLMEANCTQ